jgi:hypothetical protein
MQRMSGMVEHLAFGRILEANTGFRHSSDLDPAKAINWKHSLQDDRRTEFRAEYRAWIHRPDPANVTGIPQRMLATGKSPSKFAG